MVRVCRRDTYEVWSINLAHDCDEKGTGIHWMCWDRAPGSTRLAVKVVGIEDRIASGPTSRIVLRAGHGGVSDSGLCGRLGA